MYGTSAFATKEYASPKLKSQEKKSTTEKELAEVKREGGDANEFIE